MTNPTTTSDTPIDFSALRLQLSSGSEKVQQQLIQQLAALGNPGLEVLMGFLLQRRDRSPTWIDGKTYQILYRSESPTASEFLQTHFPTGIVTLRSQCDIDYSPLQQLLIEGDFQAADRVTLQKLCEIAGTAALQRKWLYFTEVESLPIPDLQTVNTLWSVYSENKFGFSVQRELWLSLGKNWEKLWVKIGWKNGNTWTRYPDGFNWSLDAPVGHLPLSNQLRGNRAIAALFSHPAWVKREQGALSRE
jgi:hypothetical protein